MPRELVTKGSRFYCVSLVPDICKTPIGAATPPIPYMIKAEFADATGVSKNIRSNGEYVVIHASTVVPTVTGDEAGTAKGIKSGTVGKRVQHDQKSSTVSFNGERAIREGDTVFMNDKNTTGKVLQRGGAGAADTKSLGDRFDAAMDRAAAGIGGGKDWAAGKLAEAAQTKTGAAVLAALEKVAKATEIEDLKTWKDAKQKEVMDSAETIGGSGAGIAGSLTVAALEFIPTSLLDIVPYGGKAVGTVGKTAKVAAKAERAAADATRLGHKAGSTARGTKQGQGRAAPPAKGSDGGKSKGKGRKEKKDKPSSCCPKNAGPGGKAVSSRHPVHFGTGEEVLQQTDFALGGALPIVWTRCYRSGSECENWSMLGARWSGPFTAHLSVARKGIVYHDDTGRALRLPPLAIGARQDNRAEGFALARSGEHIFELTWRDGSRDRFTRHGMAWLPHGYDGVNAMLPPAAPEQCEQYVLHRSEGADGRGYSIVRPLERDDPVLLRIASDDGRVVEASRSTQDANLIGCVEEVRADGTRIRHAEYAYKLAPAVIDAALPGCHDLVSQGDRTGAMRHYRYVDHLLATYSTYGGFEHGLDWVSLAALRARWAASPYGDEQLRQMYPISTENSYQARAIATRTMDGRDEVRIDYPDEDTTRVTESGGAVFDYTFDDNWLCTHIALVSPDGGLPRSQGSRRWDADGMLLEEADALHNTWSYRYDAAGNLTASKDAEGHVTGIDYDAGNRPVRITDSLGNITQYAYDIDGNLLSVTNALGHITGFEYDQRGRTVAVVDAKGGRMTYEYDTWGNLAANTDCSGYRSTYRYDHDANLIAACDAMENETAYRYDASGQVITLSHPDGTQEHYAYDASGNVTTHTDALGHQTHYRYDGHDMLVERIDALGHSVKYRYDAALRLVELINGNGESYHFSYTPEGWLDSETGYDGKVTRYHYDRAGQLTAYESCGIRIDLTRDRMGRLTWKTTPDGITRYQYDALGRLATVVAPHAENGFRYDAVGQLLEEHSAYFISEPHPTAYKLRRVPDHYFVMRYAYDELGDRIQTVLPDGHRIDVLRYGSGHWHGVLWDGEPVVDVERDRLHRERRRQIGAPSLNLVATRTYDPHSRLATMVLKRESSDPTVRPLRERNFTYDAVGNLLSIRHGWHTRDETLGEFKYQYDAIGQLLIAEQPGHREVATFDAANGVTRIGAPISHQLPGDMEFPQVATEESMNTQTTFDERGNLIHRRIALSQQHFDELDLAYDCLSQLASSKRTRYGVTTSTEYFYDAFSRRIGKKTVTRPRSQTYRAEAESVIFIWEDDRLTTEENKESKKYYLYEAGALIPVLQVRVAIKDTEPESIATDFIHCDVSGAPRDIVDKSGRHIRTLRAEAWGKPLSPQDKSLPSISLIGQYSDLETGLHYNRHRYYDPDAARYITQDPIGIAGGYNLYQYVGNPLQWTDPLGLTKCKKFSGQDELASLPKLNNLLPSQVRKILKGRGYSMVGSRTNPAGANTGGQVWTKSMPDGNTVGVRIDPATVRNPPLGRADEVPHAHKELVKTPNVEKGNYGQADKYTDCGLIAVPGDFKGMHIEIRKGKLVDVK